MEELPTVLKAIDDLSPQQMKEVRIIDENETPHLRQSTKNDVPRHYI
jgi:hypothetical protein